MLALLYSTGEAKGLLWSAEKALTYIGARLDVPLLFWQSRPPKLEGGMSERMERAAGIRFIRRQLDAALFDAPPETYGDPIRYFDNGRTLALSERIVRAMRQAGWGMVSSSGGFKKVQGIRSRIELEDLLDMVLAAAGASAVRNLEHNDRARDEVATQIWETFHRKRVVLRRIASKP